MYHTVVNKNVDIRRDRRTNEVYVIGKTGKEVFRRPYSSEIVSLAHEIYMSEKYGDDLTSETP